MRDTFYYDTLKKRAAVWKAKGRKLPAVSENWGGEKTIFSEGQDDNGHFFQIKTFQKNNWITVATYYADGTVTETYER